MLAILLAITERVMKMKDIDTDILYSKLEDASREYFALSNFSSMFIRYLIENNPEALVDFIERFSEYVDDDLKGLGRAYLFKEAGNILVDLDFALESRLDDKIDYLDLCYKPYDIAEQLFKALDKPLDRLAMPSVMQAQEMLDKDRFESGD